MGSIGRYIFRINMTAFLITLVSLTVVISFTQSMRDFDLITSERQTLFVFIGITSMIVPLLVMIIAPIALMVASAYVLSRPSQDSEMIVMNATGLSPWRLLSSVVIALAVPPSSESTEVPVPLHETALFGSAVGQCSPPAALAAAGAFTAPPAAIAVPHNRASKRCDDTS